MTAHRVAVSDYRRTPTIRCSAAGCGDKIKEPGMCWLVVGADGTERFFHVLCWTDEVRRTNPLLATDLPGGWNRAARSPTSEAERLRALSAEELAASLVPTRTASASSGSSKKDASTDRSASGARR